MSRFRLVLLDYPKLLLRDHTAKKIFSDIITSKQLGFERASDTYVSMNSLDMISTHVLIYDVEDLYQPKLVTAIRNCYEKRTHQHQLRLPCEDYIPTAPLPLQSKFKKFRETKEALVDCNAWFVDPDYTWSKTGVPLSDMAWFSLVLFTLRKGFDHWVGATNERFKASRWASKTGSFEDGLIFTHPYVKDPHKLIMINEFDRQWLMESFRKYSAFIEGRMELTPDAEHIGETLLSVETVRDSIFHEERSLKAA